MRFTTTKVGLVQWVFGGFLFMFEQFKALVFVTLHLFPLHLCVVSLYVCILSLGLCKLNLVNYIEGFVSCLSFTTRFASSLVAQGVWFSRCLSLSLSLSLCCCSSCVVQAVQVVLVVSGLLINLAWLCFLWQHHHHHHRLRRRAKWTTFFMTFYGDLWRKMRRKSRTEHHVIWTLASSSAI